MIPSCGKVSMSTMIGFSMQESSAGDMVPASCGKVSMSTMIGFSMQVLHVLLCSKSSTRLIMSTWISSLKICLSWSKWQVVRS
jgi:hypothetical protein